MGHVARSVLSRICLLLWLAVIVADILRATMDGVEDRTTTGVPAILAAAAMAVTAFLVILAAGQPPRQHRGLRLAAVALWVMDLITLAMRNTGGRHPADYLLGWIFTLGIAAATATICLAILTADFGDKARLIRALANERNAPGAPEMEHHLLRAGSASLPGRR